MGHSDEQLNSLHLDSTTQLYSTPECLQIDRLIHQWVPHSLFIHTPIGATYFGNSLSFLLQENHLTASLARKLSRSQTKCHPVTLLQATLSHIHSGQAMDSIPIPHSSHFCQVPYSTLPCWPISLYIYLQGLYGKSPILIGLQSESYNIWAHNQKRSNSNRNHQTFGLTGVLGVLSEWCKNENTGFQCYLSPTLSHRSPRFFLS